MKKHILTVVILFAFVVTNAQEKANHNTTRSNQSQGIMVKEGGLDNDCDGIIDGKLFVKMTKRGTPKQAVKETSKKHLFTKNGVTYYYNGDLNKLSKCKAQLKEGKWIELLSYDHGNNETKRKKRNKNFNRKGERIKRTNF